MPNIMSYPSVLTILPKFLWKSIFEYRKIHQLKKLRMISVCESIFDNTCCRKLMLGNKTGKIISIQMDNNRINNFWKYCIDNYVEHEHMENLFQMIQEKNIDKFMYIIVFIKSGTYCMNYHYHNFHNKKYSIFINGSKSGQTNITHREQFG